MLIQHARARSRACMLNHVHARPREHRGGTHAPRHSCPSRAVSVPAPDAMASSRAVVRGKGRSPAAPAADPAHASVFTRGACRHSAVKVAARTHVRQRCMQGVPFTPLPKVVIVQISPSSRGVQKSGERRAEEEEEEEGSKVIWSGTENQGNSCRSPLPRPTLPTRAQQPGLASSLRMARTLRSLKH